MYTDQQNGALQNLISLLPCSGYTNYVLDGPLNYVFDGPAST